MNIHIRWMIRRDMPQVLAIEQECFPNPWTEDDFIKCLRQRNCIGMVGETSDEEVVAYMVYEFSQHQILLLNLAVDPLVQRSGVGTQMVEKLKGKLSLERRRRIGCEVREGNVAGHLFFKANDFIATGINRQPWDGSEEDAYVFWHDCLTDSPVEVVPR